MTYDHVDEKFDDLKQFVAVTVSQSEQRIKADLKQDIQTLRGEMHDGFAGIGDAIELIHEELSNHDKRLTKLEKQAA